MNLRDYLYIKNIQNTQLIKDTGYSKSAIQAYLAHRTKCSDKFAKAIEFYTKGEVSYEEMIEWNKKGMENKKQQAIQAIPSSLIDEIIEGFCSDLCASCKKKLTKAGVISKKE